MRNPATRARDNVIVGLWRFGDPADCAWYCRLTRSSKSMADALELAVVRFGDGWRVIARNHRWGYFQYRVDAEEAALRLAARARSDGKAVSLLVQESNGEMRPLDLTGIAPVPP